MKKLLFCSLMICTLAAQAQKTGTAKKPAAKPAAKPAPLLKTLRDSASYAIGVQVANFYVKQQGLTDLNPALIAKAVADVVGNKQALSDMACNTAMMQYINQAQDLKSKPNIAAGEKFLATNKARAGVKTTASGLQYEIVTEGTGAKPTAEDSVTVHYRGTLLDGTEFDNSYKRGEPITFPLGGVIRGWTEALQLMPAGSKYKLYIPQQLAYGTNEVGSIPAGSLLVFEVELLKVVGK